MSLLTRRSLRAALSAVVVLLLAPVTVLVLEAPAHADAWVGELPIAQPDSLRRPWGAQCVPLPLTANDRYGADPMPLIEIVYGTSFGKIHVYDETAPNQAGTLLASGATVLADTPLCYKTNSMFFSGSDSGQYALVDPAPGHARLTGVLTFPISINEDDPAVGPAPGPTGLTAVAGDGQATLDWDADAAVDTVKVFVDGVIVDTRSVSSTGPLVVGGLTNGLHYAFSVYRPGGSLVSRPTHDVVPGVVPAAPTDLAAARGAGDTVDLSWTAPDEVGDPALTGYRVDYALDGVAQTPVDVTGAAATLSGVADDQELTATVTAVSDVGDGPASDSAVLHPVLTDIEVVAPSTAVRGVPVDVDIRAVDATGDTAEWFAGPVQVTSSDNTASLPADAALVDGEATVSVTFADPGTQTVTVTGGGLDGTSDDVTVGKEVPSLTLHLSDDVELGGAISVSATLADGLSAAGIMTIRAYGPGDTTCAAPVAFTSPVAVAGNGTYSSNSFTPTTVGDYRWTATYSGDSNNAASTASCSTPVVVEKRTTHTTLAGLGHSLVGEQVTLRATVDPADVTGTVTFRDGDASLGSAKVEDGVAELAVTFTKAGQHLLSSEYGGDGRSAASTSGPAVHAVQVVAAADPPQPPRARLMRTALRLHGSTVKLRIRCLRSSDTSCQGVVQLRRAGQRIGRTAISLEPGTTTTVKQHLGRKARRSLKRTCGRRPAKLWIGLPSAQGPLVWQTTKVTIRARACKH